MMVAWLLLNSANIITFSRIIVTPIALFWVPWPVYFDPPWDIGVRILLYVLLAMTDRLDGYIARKIKNTEGIGKALDPIADKIMHVYGLTFLWTTQLLDQWMIVLITGGEVIVFGIVIRAILLVEKPERMKHKNNYRLPALRKLYWIELYRLVKAKLINDLEVEDLGKIKMGFFFAGYSFIAINVFFGPAGMLSFFYLVAFFSGAVLSYYADFKYYNKFEKWKKDNLPEN